MNRWKQRRHGRAWVLSWGVTVALCLFGLTTAVQAADPASGATRPFAALGHERDLAVYGLEFATPPAVFTLYLHRPTGRGLLVMKSRIHPDATTSAPVMMERGDEPAGVRSVSATAPPRIAGQILAQTAHDGQAVAIFLDDAIVMIVILDGEGRPLKVINPA